jgi:ElaB/YqjD/DUF883 family membrane-anchored ribosome-binding protein
MHLHSKAEELVNEIKEQIQDTQDELKKQALQDALAQAEYLATRLKEIGSE